MSPGLILSLLLSVFLVGGATWTRFVSPSFTLNNKLTVVNSYENEDDKGFLDNFLGEKADTNPAPEVKPVTTGDILGKGLLSDYINLATNNKATDANIEAVANKYLKALPALTQSELITYDDIEIVANNKNNFEKYGQTFAQTQLTLAQAIGIDHSSENFSKAYKEAAAALKNSQVPASIALNHLVLVNLYLSNSASMEAISKMNNDPTVAFSGLVTINENLTKEVEIVAAVASILHSNGI